jgi:hypothetical protein
VLLPRARGVLRDHAGPHRRRGLHGRGARLHPVGRHRQPAPALRDPVLGGLLDRHGVVPVLQGRPRADVRRAGR